MKQATLRSLGVAVLGAALAAVTAGTASAAGTLEGATTTVTGASRGLPLEEVAPLLPGGPVVQATKRTVDSGVLEQSAKAADMALAPNVPTRDNKGNAGPLGSVTKLVPANGFSLPGLGTGNR